MKGGRLRRLHMGLKRRLGLVDPPMLMPYLGYAGEGGLWLRGRVLEDEGVVSAPHTNSALHNLWLTYKRFSTDEISGARVLWECGEARGEVVSDRGGYIELNMPGIVANSQPWLPVRLTLDHAPGYQAPSTIHEGLVRIVSDKARFVVVSDIDDTIIHTGANQILRHWRVVTANSPESRIAFPGVAEFYHALAAGADGPETNPLFYVSSGPWNLFDLYDRFMGLRGIPRGPMLLRNLSSDGLDWILRRHNGHKTRMIEALLRAYPHLPFVLIGDSGQDDAAIYHDIATRFPGRVALVHIHDIRPGSPGRAVDQQIGALRAIGIPVTLSATLVEAARLAEQLGFVKTGTTDSVTSVVKDRIQGGPLRL